MLENNRFVNQPTELRRTVYSRSRPVSRQAMTSEITASKQIKSILDLKQDTKDSPAAFAQLSHHPLWLGTLNNIIKALKLSPQSAIKFPHYKEIRISVDRSLHSKSQYEDSLCAIWKEWTDLTKEKLNTNHKKITSILELSIANGSISSEALGRKLAGIINEYLANCNVFLFLFILNLIYLNVTEGNTVKESKLKKNENIQTLPDSAMTSFTLLTQGKPKYFGLSQLKILLVEQLSLVFPRDPRVYSLWQEYDKVETFLKHVRNNSPPLNYSKKRIDSVRLSIYGKACEYSSPRLRQASAERNQRTKDKLRFNTPEPVAGEKPKRATSVNLCPKTNKNKRKEAVHKITPIVQCKLQISHRPKRFRSRRKIQESF